MNKPKTLCTKCQRNISNNNYQRHVDACAGPIVKKIRYVDYDPNGGYKDGSRVVWNKGIKTGPRESSVEYHRRLRSIRDTAEMSHGGARRKVIEEQNNCCNRCGIYEWQGEVIVLELEHKNGIRSDNSRENLEALCPNCHSLTPTWRGRNRRSVV